MEAVEPKLEAVDKSGRTSVGSVDGGNMPAARWKAADGEEDSEIPTASGAPELLCVPGGIAEERAGREPAN